MSSPAIKHTDLFDFDGYEKGIQSLNQSTSEFISNTNKLVSSLKGTFADLQTQMTGKKAELVNTNDVASIKQMDSEVNNLSVSIKNNRDAINGLNIANRSVAESSVLLTTNAKGLQSQFAALTDEEKKSEAIGGVIIKQMASQKVASKEFADAVASTAKDIQSADGSYNALSNSLLKMKNELKNLPGAFDPATGGLNKNNKAAVDLADKISLTDKAVKSMDTTMGVFGRNVGNYESATVPLKTQLREIVQALQQMQVAGQEESAEFERMAKKAGEIKLAMAEVGETVKSAGAKFLGLKAGLEVMEGVAAGATVATGAMALLGNENDKFKENLIKVESAMAIMQGLQKLSALIEKDSMAVRYILNIQAKLQILYTQLQGAAESKNIIVRYAAAAAQWVLNAAMNANPVGILIAGAVILAGIFLYLSRNTQKATEAQIRLNEAQKRWIEQRSEEASLIADNSQAAVNDAEEDLKLAKAKNATLTEQMNLEVEVLKARKTAALETKILYASDIKDLDTLKERYVSLKGQLDLMIDSTRKGDEKGQKEIEAVKGQVENLTTRIKGATAAQENYFKTDSDLAAKNYENKQILIERDFKSTIAADEAKLAKTKVDSASEYNAKIKLLDDKRDIELKNVNLTQGEIQKLNSDHDKAVYETTKSYNEKIAKSSIQTKISGLNYELAYSRTNSEDELRIKKSIIDQSAKLEIVNAENSINTEVEKAAKIKEIFAKSNREKEDLDKERQRFELQLSQESIKLQSDLAKTKNEQIIEDPHSSNSAKVTAIKAIADAQMKSYDDQFTYLKTNKDLLFDTEEQYQNAVTQLTNDKEGERLKIIKDKAQQEREIKQALFDFAGQAATSLTTIFKDQSDARIETINAEKDKAIKAAGDNANAKARIENEYNKKIAVEKNKQAKMDKASALFQIVLNTAMGVTNALSKPIITGWMVPIIIATGALQAAAILAKPLPTYRKGTRNAPEGLAVVNDEPGANFQEAVERNGKLLVPKGRNAMVNLKKGDKVFTATETMNIFRNIGSNQISGSQSLNDQLSERIDIGRRLEVQHIMTGALGSLKVDENHIIDGIGNHIANITQTTNVFDERGHSKYVRHKNTIINDLNNKNSLTL